jgi:Ca2+-binding EF-hand superfamily protein
MAIGSVSALQAFRFLDVDGGGSVSQKEFTNGLGLLTPGVRQAVGATSAQKVFAAMDKDSNGALSNDELAQGLALLNTDTAGALLAAQDQQSPVAQMLAGLQSGAYSTLPGVTTGLGSVSAQVLAAYANWK